MKKAAARAQYHASPEKKKAGARALYKHNPSQARAAFCIYYEKFLLLESVHFGNTMFLTKERFA